MIQISQIRIPCGQPQEALEKKIRKKLRLHDSDALSFKISRHAVDARKKPDLFDVYSVLIEFHDKDLERSVLKKNRDPDVTEKKETIWHFPAADADARILPERPVVIGMGPAGLFCALALAGAGFRPLLLERGKSMEERVPAVEGFFAGGPLDPAANIQFGEGGAGTFSDGKLTTNVRDREGRNAWILNAFIRNGADPDIAYEALPHIGTDVLRGVIVGLRRELENAGAEIRFENQVMGFDIREGRICGVKVKTPEGMETLPASVCVLAPGHSARDTFRTLLEEGIPMEPKPFAVGLRVIHPQSLVNFRQYGISDPEKMKELRLPPASYKLTGKTSSKRAVYSFCMCPGGYVVNASSQAHRLAVNGMSGKLRDGKKANSAIVLAVGPGDFGTGILSGMEFQEKIEERAFALAGGAVPVEHFSDFEAGLKTGSGGDPLNDPERLGIKGRCQRASLETLYPRNMTEDFKEGMHRFERVIPGFAGPEALLAGPETRTSSPVRITRGADCQSAIEGLYPCGEGAGFAGGIMSAALDGMKVAEAIGKKWRSKG